MEIIAGFTFTPEQKAFLLVMTLGFFLIILSPGIFFVYLGLKKRKTTIEIPQSHLKLKWQAYIIIGFIYFVSIPGYFFINRIYVNYRSLTNLKETVYILNKQSGYSINDVKFDSVNNQLVTFYENRSSGKIGMTSYQMNAKATESCISIKDCETAYRVANYPEKLGYYNDVAVYGKTDRNNASVVFSEKEGGTFKLHERLINSNSSGSRTKELYKLLDSLEPSDNLFVLAIKNSFPVLR